MKIPFYIVFFCLIFSIHSMAQSDFNINDLYYSALGGNVSSIITKLDETNDSKLDEKQLEIKNKYYHRFKFENEEFKFKTSDTVLISVYNIYLTYWKNALLNRLSLSDADHLFTSDLTEYIWNIYYKDKDVSKDSIYNDITTYSKNLLNERGFNVANGRTGPYFDLLVWSKENKVNYKVELPETKIDVHVVFMEDVVSLGWEEYATFGRYYPGGWATSDALYCVGSAYDLNSETFRVSYLQHEGQHFADYKVYAKLSGADLEYRAKLVELIYRKDKFYELISFFINNASHSDRSNSHGFANYCMLRDLSKTLLKNDFEKDIEKWKKISIADINAAALKLFKQNTASLNKVGKEVKELIN